jgi:LSD1 subclass zinc finger protein
LIQQRTEAFWGFLKETNMDTVRVVCQNCPTEVEFPNVPGAITVKCPECQTVVYSRPETETQREMVSVQVDGKDVPGAKSMAANFTNQPPHAAGPKLAPTHDGNITPKPCVLTAKQRTEAKRLLDW